MGKSLDSPDKGNIDKMPEKRRKIVRKMSKNYPEGLKTQFTDIFLAIFAHLVGAFVWWPCPILARYSPQPIQKLGLRFSDLRADSTRESAFGAEDTMDSPRTALGVLEGG